MAETTRSPSPSGAVIKISNLENGDPLAMEQLYTRGLNVAQDFGAYMMQRIMRLDPNRSLAFTADAAADTLSFSVASGAVDGMAVVLATSGTLPTGWSTLGVYFLRDVSSSAEGGTAKLALTSGGAAVTITDAGTGSHTLKFLPYLEAPVVLSGAASHTITPYAQMIALGTPTANRTVTLYDSRAVAGQYVWIARPATGAFSWTVTRETSGDSIVALPSSTHCGVLMMAYEAVAAAGVKWHPLIPSMGCTLGIDP